MRTLVTEFRNSPRLNQLEQILQLPLVDLLPFVGSSSKQLKEFQDLLPSGTNFAVLVRIPPHESIIKKVYHLLCTIIRVNFLRRQLSSNYKMAVDAYGVYPSPEDPVAVYALGTTAEEYINKNVLPALPSGLNGYFRQLIMKLTKCHPSVGGILILAQTM